MLLQRYLQTIDNIDPGKIYVENVRSIYNLPRSLARFICEVAVQERIFSKKIGIVCPRCNRIIEEYNSYSEIPSDVYCHICEAEEAEQFLYKKSDLKKEEYYKLIV
jgi:hypothetical protein